MRPLPKSWEQVVDESQLNIADFDEYMRIGRMHQAIDIRFDLPPNVVKDMLENNFKKHTYNVHTVTANNEEVISGDQDHMTYGCYLRINQIKPICAVSKDSNPFTNEETHLTVIAVDSEMLYDNNIALLISLGSIRPVLERYLKEGYHICWYTSKYEEFINSVYFNCYAKLAT